MARPAPDETTEGLREALLSLRLDHEALGLVARQSQHLLDALDSLLAIGPTDDPFVKVFDALRGVFEFAQARMLVELPSGGLECIVADPSDGVGSVWPLRPLLNKVLGGRVITTVAGAAEPDAGGTSWQADTSNLFLPVRVRDRRGILALQRAPGTPGFDRQHVALARRCALLASHALATRVAHQSEVESRRLRELTQQLRLSEQVARRNADLLNEVVNMLPVGLTVQDQDGRCLLINDTAAAAIGEPALALRGRRPMSHNAEAQRVLMQRLEQGRTHVAEREVAVAGKTLTLLSTDKPVRIFDERLLLSTWLDITERKRHEVNLARRAYHDELTGLPNRERMRQIVDQAMQQHVPGQLFALAFIDLDNFKQINDGYSHHVGDHLLMAVAQRLRDKLRPGDHLSRISGDEFLLLINPLSAAEDLPPIIERMVEALKEPFLVDGLELLTSASVGASLYPLHGDSYDTLRRCADSAMYSAKHSRKGSAGYFDPSQACSLQARVVLEQRLRGAIRDGHFRAAYQPKLRMATGEVVGFEALVRWVEPDGQVHLPGSFIELASELGLIDDITRFVLLDIERNLPLLSARYGANVSVSLNVSARQATDVSFMQTLTERLTHGGLAHRVVLELTEDALLAAQRFQADVLPNLRAHGVRVSIDDFGTGYSSLSTLADITADEVKVDRAFITAIHERRRSQGILRAIESLCRALDIGMVAEGVETAQELAYLRKHTSIELAQGYLFARPAFVEDLPERFETFTPGTLTTA
jgi:c-di-GMP phosphodiesterase Gmr